MDGEGTPKKVVKSSCCHVISVPYMSSTVHGNPDLVCGLLHVLISQASKRRRFRLLELVRNIVDESHEIL